MSDWIGKIKDDAERDVKQARHAEELRLHKARVVTAKGNAYWRDLASSLERDCAKLREIFPEDGSKHCSVQVRGDEVVIRNQKRPIKVVTLTNNILGQCIECSTEVSEDRGIMRLPLHSTFRFVVDPSEDLFIVSGSNNLEPDGLAEIIIKSVCGMKG